MSLRIMTYNCQYANVMLYSQTSKTEKACIILLQETLLSDDNNFLVKEINDAFNYAHVAAVGNPGTFVP